MFNNLSEQLIHRKLQSDELSFTKAKTLLILLLFFLCVLIGYSSFFLVKNPQFNIKTTLNLLGILAVLIALFLLKKTQNIKNPTRILNYLGMILITGGVYLSGGLASNDILWYFVCSVSSLLFIGMLDGIIATSVSLLAITTFYLIDILKLVDFPYDELTRGIHYRYINAVIIVTILFFLVLVLVKRNHRLHGIIKDIQSNQMRESISQDFHDELGNKLASIVHLSKRLKSTTNQETKKNMLDVIEKEAVQVYDNFRDFIWANDTNNLTVKLLFEHLNDFNHNLFAFKDISTESTLNTKNEEGETLLRAKTARHLILIFKEIMTNIYKHAKASNVEWSLTAVQKKLTLTIVDDGIGFSLDSPSDGQGMLSINKRVKQLNSTLEISSVEQKGTRIKIEVNI